MSEPNRSEIGSDRRRRKDIENSSDDGAGSTTVDAAPPADHQQDADSPADHQQDADPPADAVGFDLEGVRAGFLTCIPVAIGVGGYGVAFGVLADRAGLSVAEAALMSATVVAGASQIVAVELWADPIPIAAVLATVVAINLRYSLMGAALRPWFRHLSPAKAYGSLLVMADENWALTVRELKTGSGRGAFLLGSGFAIWTFWVGATVVGAVAGDAVGDPARYGFDFILAAVFAALAVELWDGRSSLAPWLVALATAVGTAAILPGRWYILLGGLAAAVLEGIRYE